MSSGNMNHYELSYRKPMGGTTTKSVQISNKLKGT